MTREILRGTLGAIAFKDGLNAVLIQCSPQKRTIIAQSRGESSQYFNLYFPYTIFVVEYWLKDGGYDFYNLHVGFSDTPIASFDQSLYRLPLGNYSPPMNICCSQMTQRFFNTEKELTQFVIDYFWQSVFSWDQGITQWQELTALSKPVSSLYSKPYTIRQIFKLFSRKF